MNKLVDKLSDGKDVTNPRERALLRGFVIYIDEGKKGDVEKLAADKNIDKIALAYLPASKKEAWTKLYSLNLEAKNTVLVYKNKTVTSNFVNLSAKDFEKVVKAVEDIAAS